MSALWLAILGFGSCGGVASPGVSSNASPDAGTVGTTDGANPLTGMSPGPEACACNLDGVQRVLTISWDCFCKDPNEHCDRPFAGDSFECQWGTFMRYPECGLTTERVDTIGGPEIWVYDSYGKLVGQRESSDDYDWSCPSDATLRAGSRKAGRFPDPACAGVPCGADACGACPADGGR